MPKAKTDSKKPKKSFEETLWDTANKLRGSVESSEYKHVVLSLIFLKFVSDKFEERRAELVAEGKEDYLDMVEFYTMQNVFYLPETSRWSYIQQQAKQGDIAIKIETTKTILGLRLDTGDTNGTSVISDLTLRSADGKALRTWPR